MSARGPRAVVTPTYALFVRDRALVFTFLGAFWAVESIANWTGAPVWAYGLIAVPVIGLTAFAAAGLVSSRGLRKPRTRRGQP